MLSRFHPRMHNEIYLTDIRLFSLLRCSIHHATLLLRASQEKERYLSSTRPPPPHTPFGAAGHPEVNFLSEVLLES